MPERHVDIAIIGAGVVGLATALALAPTGLQIALFDAQPKPSRRFQGTALNDWDRRVTALTPASIRLLQSLGAWPLIEESGRGGAYTDGTIPPFFRRTIRRRHGPSFYEVQFSSLGKEESAKTQCLLFLEGRFGEDKQNACRYLGDGSGRSRRPPYLRSRIQRRHSTSFF